MDEAVHEYELTAADRFVGPPVSAIARRPIHWSARLWGCAPFLASLILHLSALLIMAGWGLTIGSRAAPAMLLASPATVEAKLEQLQEQRDMEVEIDREATVFSQVSGLPSPQAAGASLPSPLAVLGDSDFKRPVGASPLSDVNGFFSGQGQGQALAESGQETGGAEFFGVRAAGKRFVFVVDSSQSMRGRKWAMACKELIASVARLNEQQSFYVIFFDVDTHPMFSQRRPERDLIPVNEKNQKRLKRWLPSIKLGSETRPLHSMQLALKMAPDAVFLLSDGEFTDPTRDFLLHENYDEADDGSRVTRVPIHTVGFHSLAAEAVLKPIAMENGGAYRFVPGRR